MTAAERREKITAEIAAATGITEAMIERLVAASMPKSAATRRWRRSLTPGSKIGSLIFSKCARSGHR